jgi:hypothetical protein
MFSKATAFNQEVRSWDMSNVTDMSYMFNAAIDFNQELEKLGYGKCEKYEFHVSDSSCIQPGNRMLGYGGILGFAGPTIIMLDENTGIPKRSVVGVMKFDAEDFAVKSEHTVYLLEQFTSWNALPSLLTTVVHPSSSESFCGANMFRQDIASWDVSCAYQGEIIFAATSVYSLDEDDYEDDNFLFHDYEVDSD